MVIVNYIIDIVCHIMMVIYICRKSKLLKVESIKYQIDVNMMMLDIIYMDKIGNHYSLVLMFKQPFPLLSYCGVYILQV